MPENCILPSKAEELKKAFRAGEISLQELYNLGSTAKRVTFLEKYVGEQASFVNAKLEKSFISPNQKLAMRNWVYEFIGGGKPLYKGLTLEQATKMADNINVRGLKEMSPTKRIAELSKYVDEATAIDLNTKYERLRKTGNLANWEERTLGTKKLREDKKLKGSLARLETLNDLGVLNPQEMEKFFQGFIEDKLGVTLTIEQSKKLSELTEAQSKAFDKLMDSNNWTYKNEANILDYFEKRKALEKFTQSLEEGSISDTLADIARAHILASPRILKNSFFYQALPGIERSIAKRLVSGNMNSGDLDSTIIEKMQAKLSGVKPDKEMRKFIKKQTAMAIKIYHKTGYDISRMETLEGGFRFFGERFSGATGKTLKEAKGIKEKVGAGLRTYSGVANLAPKWMAGGTDTLFANLGRADTATIMSKEIAKMESMKGKLPQGVTEQQRAMQLLEESYSFNPKDEQASKIREIGIYDAHLMNATQYSEMADKLLKFRNNLGLGKFKFGKIIIPFLKIPATVKAEGLKTVTGSGVYKSIKQMVQATKHSGVARSKMMQEGVSTLVRYLGLFGAAVFVTTLLDDDDYIGAWDVIDYNRYGMARARGGSTNMIRVGGKWIPLRWLPIIDIPIAAIMTARQAKARGGDYASGLLSGVVGQIFDIPGVKETKDFIAKKLGKIAASENNAETLEAMGLNEKLWDWVKVRLLPSMISYDFYNAIKEKESKYDFQGEIVDKSRIIGWRDDKSNELTAEFVRLDYEGELPVISDPDTKYTKILEKHFGEEEYEKRLNEYKRKNTQEVIKLINSDSYKRKTDEEKKALIDKKRTKYVLDKLKFESKKYD